jgi:hypothetical protein
MDAYILRELNSGRLINSIDNKIHYARGIGSAMQFPTDDEANWYIKDNGLSWYNFGVERA